MAPSRRASSRAAPSTGQMQEENQLERPVTPTHMVCSEFVVSPPKSASRAMRERVAPDSPFTGFASNLQNLDSVERRLPGVSSLQAPASPFTALASALPNLHSSPANFSTPGANFSGGNWASSSDPIALGSQGGSLLSPLGSWPPSGNVRRTLIEDDSAEVASVTNEIESPKTPHMHFMCFGENEVTRTFTPTTVGMFGQFASMSSGRKSSDPLSIFRSQSTRPNSRRKLEDKLMCSESMSGRAESPISDMPSCSADSEPEEEELSSLAPFAAAAEEVEEENRRLSTGSLLSRKSTPPNTTKHTSKAALGKREASQPPRDASKLCRCKKSKCVRQYCVCFRAGLLCDGCECGECLNDGKHEEERKAAIDHIKTADPLAFVDKFRPDGKPEEVKGDGKAKVHVRGCRCKNSRCLKRYCECFEHGVTCSSKCECKDCCNGRPTDGESQFKKRRVAVPAPVRSETQPPPLPAPVRAPSARNAERRGVAETRVVGAGRDKIKVLPTTPHRTEFSLAPLTPLQPVPATAHLNFSRWAAPGLALRGQLSGGGSLISPVKSESGSGSEGSPSQTFGLNGAKGADTTSGEEGSLKGCALDEKAEMSICKDFGLLA